MHYLFCPRVYEDMLEDKPGQMLHLSSMKSKFLCHFLQFHFSLSRNSSSLCRLLNAAHLLLLKLAHILTVNSRSQEPFILKSGRKLWLQTNMEKHVFIHMPSYRKFSHNVVYLKSDWRHNGSFFYWMPHSFLPLLS